MATIGRNAAIAQVGRFRFSGFIACGMWMFIHLLFIEQCHNRLLVLTQWLRSYFTGARSARLIEGASGEGEVLLGTIGDDGALFSGPVGAAARIGLFATGRHLDR